MVDDDAVHEGDVWELFDVAGAFETGGPEAYLDQVLSRCSAWFKASGASIFILQEVTREYLLAGCRGVHARIPQGATLRAGEGIAGLAIAQGRPMLVLDPTTDPVLSKAKVRRRNELGSAMVIPLLTQQEACIGVLNLSRPASEPPYSERDLAKAESLARQISLAIANGRLFAKANMMVNEARQLHETLGAIIECVGFGLLVVSRFGSVISCNPEAEAIFGGKPDPERYWERFLARAPACFHSPIRQAVNRALDGEKTRLRADDADTGSAWTVVGTPLRSGGAIVAIQDVTEHERAQQEMARIKRLAEIGQMTAGIAHEIRNPLTGIRSAAQMVQQGPEFSEEFGRIIENEAIKLNELCNEFLDFAKPLSLHLESARLGEIVGQVCERHSPDFEAKGVSLLLDIEPGEPTIPLDALRVEQVCRNLLLNALQATEPGKAVFVTVKPGVLAVRDEGAGMTRETMDRLFAPFFTTKARGTGLGLSNVRKIMDGHRGTVEVESEVGRGTLFVLRFPLQEAA